ncbi:MAG: riboflavin biosynthesis protein RibF [Candidatus Schekmanbacteria bacterium RIFCSPHIGHO2_02_FULL_38_11]|uniref:Riboflavin biosynthesis protein n=1 Tax=Candidatus Schekmanbacteria bacterium RIFCSPLOWO2_12_FULL_38_15 TaxID=1817883 RepID=A0A1F7SNE0_9BACT|nr:MAG: riboflavin biosynthesis protein RibF [Candidatus Schekmanbacteria bacterium GWA2_38_9]OGL48809.1 MAG: riboflavin biosynthesis protein RibF [Candidatus Schekmanbacteria bacterium RIFCSPLOWO2_02_FULL_38_14]OGL52016.1 MAG: riboflavin biosynthesis protein RibF [Candidatus Schekmanbacteria bacterium RIFCSPHIGHO2_02_FULL_38_11]OGL55305.1 MAG: riboflavin biosynthesis protein RibF [Candidatus Schekmanbacteria bacterium RIFCSPLOWO2_12_FULL_38_15]
MKIIRGFPEKEERLKTPIIALGNFDGVHLGHQEILKRVVEKARRKGGTGIVVTFEPHPLKILSPGKCPPLIISFREKAELLEQAGIDILACLHFDREFAGLNPSEFVDKIIVEGIGAKEVFVGYDFAFGKGREGDTNTLKKLGKKFGFDVNVVEPIRVANKTVSSTLIRNLIREGNVREASIYLGRYYSVRGRIIGGDKRGRKLGFPTANIHPHHELIPKEGVYIGEVHLHDNKNYKSLINIGTRPTFGEHELNIEAFIFDFDKDIYGEFLKVSFLERIRDEVRFETSELLISQMTEDLKKAKKFFGE